MKHASLAARQRLRVHWLRRLTPAFFLQGVGRQRDPSSLRAESLLSDAHRFQVPVWPAATGHSH